MNNQTSGQNDITGNIKRQSIKNLCADTGDEKKWSRPCPRCNRIRVYSSRKTYLTTLNKNTICKSCSNSINSQGKSPSTETRRKLSEAVSGIKNGHYGKPGVNCGKKFGHHHKLKMSMSQKGKRWTEEFRQKMMKIRNGRDYRESCRKSAIRRMVSQRLNGNIHARSFNKSACHYFDYLNQEHGWNLQHASNGGEVECHGYFLDAYDKHRNIVIEYDESRHYKINENVWSLIPKDIVRMNDIKHYLGCDFYRYNEKTDELRKY